MENNPSRALMFCFIISSGQADGRLPADARPPRVDRGRQLPEPLLPDEPAPAAAGRGRHPIEDEQGGYDRVGGA